MTSTDTPLKTSGTIYVGTPSSTVNKTFLSNNTVVLGLNISHTFILDLEVYKRKHKHIAFTDIINQHCNYIQLKPSSRLESRFTCLCSIVSNKFKPLKGKRRREYASKITVVHVFAEELLNVNTFCDEVRANQQELDCLSTTPTNNTSNLACSQSKDLDTFSKSHRYRTIETLRNQTAKALRFLETMGLNPKSLHVETSSGMKLRLTLNDTRDQSNTELIRMLTFILDRFGISEAAYHELAQLVPALPRKHSMVEFRKEQSALFDVQRTRGSIPGAMISFKAELLKAIDTYLKEYPNTTQIRVKLGGDGTRVSRVSNFVVFSFHLVNKHHKLSSLNQITLAILSCKEDYFNLKSSLLVLFAEVEVVLAEGFVLIGDKRVDVEVLFGADMKMLQIMLGLGGSTGNYACPWCLVHKKDRHVTSVDWQHYHSTLERKTEGLQVYADKLQFGSLHAPLLSLGVHNYVIDILHLMMRITDVLERNLIEEATQRDRKMVANKEKPHHIVELVECFQKCGVGSFAIWEDKDSNKQKWTSMSGNDKMKVLQRLPDMLNGILSPDTETTVIQIWKTFYDIYDVANHGKETGKNIFLRAKTWLELFLSLNGELKRIPNV